MHNTKNIFTNKRKRKFKLSVNVWYKDKTVYTTD